jgi:NAD kinase
MYKIDQSIILVTRKTRLDDLTAKYATKSQARFYVARARVNQAVARAPAAQQNVQLFEQQAQAELDEVEHESKDYKELISRLRRDLDDFDLPVQVVDRSLVPNMVFAPRDIVVALGQDGLVANVAKYALGLPIIGVNPNPKHYDGILLPFEYKQARAAVQRTLEGRAKTRNITLAQAKLNNGQRLLAFNDLFIGARSHVSARYRVEIGNATEDQSSSGLLVSTGAGSTGWLSSILNMTAGIMSLTQKPAPPRPALRLQWEDRKLIYVVREPFISKTSSAKIVVGTLNESDELTIESLMGPEGTIFSDGIESDALPFAEGAIATISVAKEKAKLVVP